jgi:hypothetical protein
MVFEKFRAGTEGGTGAAESAARAAVLSDEARLQATISKLDQLGIEVKQTQPVPEKNDAPESDLPLLKI